MQQVHCALTAVGLALLAVSAPAATFQYTVPLPGAKGQSTAFLWIPPQAKQVRGVIMGGMTLMEREFAKDARIREACAAQQLAIVFLKCGLGGPDLQKVLDDLAKVSGYRELSVAPLMFVGHSAGGPPAKGLAIRMAGRCFGLVQYRGGAPWGGEAVPPGVPTLMMIGQFDEFGGMMRNEAGRETWEGSRDGMAGFRAADERHLSSVVVEPGAGHFAWSDRNAAYLALFIAKAAAARIPETRPVDADKPVALKDVDHKSGWLTDLTIKTAGEFAPAPYEQYKGDKIKANWHFDKELAEATVAYHAGISGKKDQFVKWTDPCWVDAGARYFFSKLKWVGDGQTLEVHPVYAEAYPATHSSGQGPRWADAGKPVGHSNAPILVKQVSGPLVVTGPNTLRIKYDELAPATEAARPTFMAYSVGDAEYRYTEHVGMMPRGFGGLTGGKPQTITFPPMGKLKADSAPVELKASSDSGLPVEFHVGYGPASIVDGKLKVADLPARASFPIEVKVVAYQFGSGVEPLIKTATPVEQTIMVEKP
jgi:pimeloyl-ACP methyl ester carboxylesterase